MEEAEVQDRPAGGTQIVRFGTFDLCLRTGELRKQGVRVRLQGKPFHILKALLEEPGRVVTRDELKKRLWAADTFVDFESGLNTAANRLRSALGDSAENPIYIETLARVGYRFIAPVVVAEPVQMAAVAHAGNGLAARGDAYQIVAPVKAMLPVKIEDRWHGFRMGKGTTAALAVAVLTLIAAAVWPLLRSYPATPSYHQLTFRKGFVEKARFAPDGRSIVFGAEWEGEPSRVFLSDAVNPDPRSLGYDDAYLASVSRTSTIAFFNQPAGRDHMILKQSSFRGGDSRPLSESAYSADWGANGALAIVTLKDSLFSIEFPVGKPVYSTTSWISDLRVSPKSNQVAFLEHPVPGDDAGKVVVVDDAAHARVLSAGWGTASGLAWSASGKEVWFTAASSGLGRALMAVDLHGKLREIARTPGGLHLEDVSSSGKVLITRSSQHMSMALRRFDDNSFEEISRFDWSRATAITEDGQSILFDESGEGGGRAYSVYLYHVPKRSFERLGDGRSVDMSPDGRWVLTQGLNETSTLNLIPTDGSQKKTINGHGLTYRWVRFLPQRNEILFSGNYPGKSAGLYRQSIPDGAPILLCAAAPAGRVAIDQTGRTAVAYDSGHNVIVYDLGTGTSRNVKARQSGMPLAFIDVNHVLIRCRDRGYIAFDVLNLDSGDVTPFRRVEDRGSEELVPVYMTGDLNTFVYSKFQSQSDLFVVTGWS